MHSGSDLPPRLLMTEWKPLSVEAGEAVPLEYDTIERLLSACRLELQTLFGYTAENRDVGITGSVSLVELDGPDVVVKLEGRFWHQRPTVLERVKNYIEQRCPEVVDVRVDDIESLSDEANVDV